MVLEGKSINAVHANFLTWFSTAAIFASSLNVFLSNVNCRAVVHLETFSLSWQLLKLQPRTWKNKSSKSSCINVSILIGMRRERFRYLSLSLPLVSIFYRTRFAKLELEWFEHVSLTKTAFFLCDNLEKGFSCCTILLQHVWCWLRLRAKANMVKDVLFICELEIISRLTKYNYTFESTLVWKSA